MKKLRFLERPLAGDAYYIPGTQVRGTALFLYGFPAFIGPNEAVRQLVGARYAVLAPHYLGTYDSDGLHSPQSFEETTALVERAASHGSVTQAKDGKPFVVPGPIEVCVAHSFGCIVALRSLHRLPLLRTLVLLAPALHYSRTAALDVGLLENGPQHYEYVKHSHPFTYRLDDFEKWRELLTGNDPLPTLAHPTLENVFVVVGEQDKYFERNALRESGERVVRAYAGGECSYDFRVLTGAGHPLDELLSVLSLEDLLPR